MHIIQMTNVMTAACREGPQLKVVSQVPNIIFNKDCKIYA